MGNNEIRTWKFIKKEKHPVRKLLVALNTYIPPRRTQDYSYLKINEQDTGEYNVWVINENDKMFINWTCYW